jgi:hypothetical protein
MQVAYEVSVGVLYAHTMRGNTFDTCDTNDLDDFRDSNICISCSIYIRQL